MSLPTEHEGWGKGRWGREGGEGKVENMWRGWKGRDYEKEKRDKI